jgi:6-phosphogluconolactonase
LQFIKKLSALIAVVGISCNTPQYLLVTGTYTNTGSAGIYLHHFNEATGELTLRDSVRSSNPSFLALSANHDFLYAVNEDAGKNGGALSSFSFDPKNALLRPLNTRSSMGDHPCHLAIDKTGRWMMVANYSSGTMASYRIDISGKLDSAHQVIQLTGKSIHPKRQLSAHAHQVIFSPDNRYLYVADLGSDKLMIYSFNANSGQLTPASPAFVQTRAGSGPRHMAFHPKLPIAWLLEELHGTLTSFSYDKNTGALSNIATQTTLQHGFTGYAGSAELIPSADGRFLYASNRGDANNIASFTLDKKTGLPKMLSINPSMGKAPRHFSIHPSGKYLLVANMDTDEIVVFNRDPKTGLFSDSGKRTGIKKPVCLIWLKK